MRKPSMTRIKDIDWQYGGGMIMVIFSVIWILMIGTLVIFEVGGWYYTNAACQTKTDAIAEGVAIIADSGYVKKSETITLEQAANLVGNYGFTSATSMPKIEKGETVGYYKSLTELNNEYNNSYQNASKMRERLVGANIDVMANIIKDFKYEDNLEGASPATGLGQLNYHQRVYEGVGYTLSDSFTGLVNYSSYEWGTNGRILIKGNPLPIESARLFNFMYPDDPRVPVSALTNNTGGNMYATYTPGHDPDETLGLWKDETSELNEEIEDSRSGALYNSVLDQFNVEEDNARYKNCLNIYTVYFYNEDNPTLGLKGNDYIYTETEDPDAKNTVTLNPGNTLLWDIATAMHINLPRYSNKENRSEECYFSDWMKGHKYVQLGDIDLGCSKIKSCDLKSAITHANEGYLAFGVNGNDYYFVRPAETDGRYDEYGGEAEMTYVNVLFVGENGVGKNNIAYHYSAISTNGYQYYYVDDK